MSPVTPVPLPAGEVEPYAGAAMVIQRILKATSATVSVAYYEGDAIVDPGVTTVQVLRDDGTELVAALTATGGSGANPRTFALTPTHTALLDHLTLNWTAADGSVVSTRVEIVGGFLFSLQAARQRKPMDDTDTYSVATLEAARTLAEQALEDACQVAFVPRYGRKTLDGSGTNFLDLGWAQLRAVRSVSLNSSSVSTSTFVPRHSGLLYNPVRWTKGFSNYNVAFEHGYDMPPERVARFARELARRWLIDSPLDDRMTSMITENGTFQFATAGMRGMVFDLPEGNVIVEQYGQGPLVR